MTTCSASPSAKRARSRIGVAVGAPKYFASSRLSSRAGIYRSSGTSSAMTSRPGLTGQATCSSARAASSAGSSVCWTASKLTSSEIDDRLRDCAQALDRGRAPLQRTETSDVELRDPMEIQQSISLLKHIGEL